MEDQGLDRKRGTGPLTNNGEGNTTLGSGRIQQEEAHVVEQGTGPLEEVEVEVIRPEGYTSRDGSTGPLPTRGESSSETRRGDIRKVQRSMTQFVVQQRRGDTETSDVVDKGMPPSTGTLYDTANNLSMIRDMRGDCVVRNGFCQEHEQYAQKVTMKKNTWTRNSRTGLFGYRMRKVSVLRCNRTMGTLVDTI